MEQILVYAQIVLAVLLTGSVLIQQKGSGLSSAMGGSGIEYSTKRGADKFFFRATIVLAILFMAVSIWRIL